MILGIWEMSTWLTRISKMAEWEQSQHAFWIAIWGSMFYVITTDILGPWGVRWSLAVGTYFSTVRQSRIMIGDC